MGPPKGQIRKLEGRIQRVEGTWHDLSVIRSHLGRVKEQVETWESVKKGAEETGRKLEDLDAQIKPIRSYVAEYSLRQDLVAHATLSGKGLLAAGLLPRVTKLENFRHEVAFRLVTLEEQLIMRDRLVGALWMTMVAPSPTKAALHATNVRTVWEAATKHWTSRMEGLGGAIANQEANAAPQRAPVPLFVPTFATNTPASTDNTPSASL